MRLKSNLVLREVAGQHVIVPIGKRAQEIPSLIYITETAAYLWDYMSSYDFEVDDLVKQILKTYDVDEKIVRIDMENFVQKLSDHYLLDDGRIHGRIYVENKKGM